MDECADNTTHGGACKGLKPAFAGMLPLVTHRKPVMGQVLF